MTKIKKDIGWSVVVVGLSSLIGCSSPPISLVTASDNFLQTVGSEYTTYVENDSKLTDSEKNLRVAHVESFRKAIDAVKGETAVGGTSR